ncbi:MAG: plasmid mobilization protein [Thermoplasmataceae archaeon]
MKARDAKISLRCTSEVKERLQKKAETNGLTLSEFLVSAGLQIRFAFTE